MSALYHTRSLIARFRELTGKTYVEWTALLRSQPHASPSAAVRFLESQGLNEAYSRFLVWTCHSHIRYNDDQDNVEPGASLRPIDDVSSHDDEWPQKW